MSKQARQKQVRRTSKWDFGDSPELKIHRIHAYPAKFPAFITTKAIAFARTAGVNVRTVADVFCGCGTTAFEARKAGLSFWGCDINPVATLIARVKSASYDVAKLEDYYTKIQQVLEATSDSAPKVEKLPERLNYWFEEASKNKLARLLNVITENVDEPVYRDFFLCAFSNILKAASRWLTKSIKPQVDPNKEAGEISPLFKKQVDFMIKAVEEANLQAEPPARIEEANLLTLEGHDQSADIIVTSPPYVTSYEYADLHQLSTLWLGYTDDYRSFRKGTIGSVYNADDDDAEERKLVPSGRRMFRKLKAVDSHKARTSLRYFMDMDRAVQQCKRFLRPGGMIFLVIGDTEYKEVKVENSIYLKECLARAGFSEIHRTKRHITGKILTPFRNAQGRFSKSANSEKKIYAEEYVLTGRLHG
ncbi:MAG: hypothetical protein IJQ73_00680 [Kiritimatiellae bacterium]|nr:hypothetical protein [Kiritimatiellia bacterium]